MLVTSPEVDAIRGAVSAAMDVRAADLTDSELVGDLELLFVARAQADALIAERLAVADARNTTVALFGRCTRAFLVEEMYVDKAAAARKLKVAREIRRWPAIEDAWRAGDISEDHVLVIIKALASVPAEVVDVVEKGLLEFATQSAPHLVAKAVDEILLACGVESSADEAAARRYGSRGLTLARTFGGTGSLSATLSALLAEKLEQALRHAMDPKTPDDERSMPQLRHDALEKIVDHYLGSDEVPDQVDGEPAARVIVTIPLAVLEGRLESAWGTLPSGAQIGPETARRLACDASVIPIVLGGRGEIHDQGRARRTFSPATRRAAWLRDGGRCVFPACQNRPVECHHIEHWARGGRSDLDNAAWLCAFHHRLAHEGRWSLRRDRDGSHTWTGPLGQRRTTSNAPPLLR